MKIKRLFMFAVCLLAWAASGSATAGLFIHTPSPLTVGSVIEFSVMSNYAEAECENPDGSRVISWYVACENGSGWHSESLSCEPGMVQTLDFEDTYTVTEADVNNPNFCFMLYSRSGCWEAPRPELSTRKCLTATPPVSHIRIRKYATCRILPLCPNCVVLHANGLVGSLDELTESANVVLLRNGKRVARLGKVGPGYKLPARVEIALPADSGVAPRRKLSGFQLQVQGKKGVVLASGEVTLHIK